MACEANSLSSPRNTRKFRVDKVAILCENHSQDRLSQLRQREAENFTWKYLKLELGVNLRLLSHSASGGVKKGKENKKKKANTVCRAFAFFFF